MTDFRGFKGAAKLLDDIDLPKLGARIGVGEDEMHAVIDVETSGGAWDRQGRPKMLFEPHVFYRNLDGATRDKAVAVGLAYATWGAKPYPADSYPRLLQAMAIDETGALKAASWGLGQILGENHAMAGFATPQAMVLVFLDDAEAHLAAMVAFIIASGLDDDIRRHDWSGFARGYNGPGYAKNRYHLKLATAFAKWSKIRDTPWSQADAVAAANDNAAIDASPVALSRGDKGDQVKALQTQLRDAGVYAATLDGDFGAATEAAVRSFQKSRGLTVDGWAGLKTVAALSAALQTAPVVVAAPAPAVMPRAAEPTRPVLPGVPIAPAPPPQADADKPFTDEQILTMMVAGATELLRRKAA
ncbi:N-acetylmuramidase domain-containing protein [Aureimonas glaciei]|uniref:DUF3380 domain-containing protein n=1 Tax=Aureimonas glaciei TaxID=1776957 RepID=A0A916YEX1_9HYPH|nr:N-acetylmuramidase domain-containing protein [Aureimonas glaciei]GGD41823.1 hypothetical protein GCM10011335_50650 [Aureimonas glaciei]